MAASLQFIVLAVDSDSTTVLSDRTHMAYAMMANNILWKQPKYDATTACITEGARSLAVSKANRDSTEDEDAPDGYVILLQGTFEEIEARRIPLLQHLKRQGFDLTYVLKDEVSGQIAQELYPLLYRVENALRRYLISFMVTKLGARWWDIVATAEQRQKVNNRKNNEKNFSEWSDNKAYLVDFGDIGRVIYQQSAGFKGADDLLKQVLAVQDTPDAIRSLKERLQSNYHRYFRDSFKDKQFQQKWEALEELRNKVAHNSLFVRADRDGGRATAEDVLKIIEDADESIADITIPIDETVALRESFSPAGYFWERITPERFLAELAQQEQHRNKRRYVGLTHFVKIILGAQGFDYSTSYRIADDLEKEGRIEKYDVTGERDGSPIPAIRTRPAGNTAGT